MQYLLQILHLFNVCLVTKPLGVFSSETKWLNTLLLFLRMNYVKNVLNNCIAKNGGWVPEVSRGFHYWQPAPRLK